ncbi:MAG: hypothetical protein WAU24_12835 [Chitinophagaceae bacterium]
MKRKIFIQLKAFFLLIVFSLNSVIGFGCAAGINMGFNAHHHEENAFINSTHHTHAADKDHQHENDATKTPGDNDNCCHDKVVQITQSDKLLPNTDKLVNFPVFVFTPQHNIFNPGLYSSIASTHTKYFVRSHHPPIADIRIYIQSFQI